MGLDMYLEARKYIPRKEYNTTIKDYEDNPNYKVIIEDTFAPGLNYYSEYAGGTVSMNVAQWRKANQIHGWFVNNVQGGEDNCTEYYVSQEQLEELAQTIDQILDIPAGTEERNALADDLLPATTGFFFGGYEYDEYYYEQLEYTLKMIKHLTNHPEYAKLSFYYSSSW